MQCSNSVVSNDGISDRNAVGCSREKVQNFQKKVRPDECKSVRRGVLSLQPVSGHGDRKNVGRTARGLPTSSSNEFNVCDSVFHGPEDSRICVSLLINDIAADSCSDEEEDIITAPSGSEDNGEAFLARVASAENGQDFEVDETEVLARGQGTLWTGEEGRTDVVMKRDWLKVGCFNSESEMFREKLQGRVSRWKVKKVSTGLKVFYRCNKFKYYGCNYRMYAENRGPDRIVLYESGFHDHSSRKLKTSARVVVDAKPSSSQQIILDQFIQNATKSAKLNGALSGIVPSTSDCQQSPHNIVYEHDKAADMKGFTDDGLLPPVPAKSSPKGECDEEPDTGEPVKPLYVLSDGNNISELLHVASDMDLAFTYNPRRTGEFCFESNAQNMRGRLVVFADLGTKVAVRERFNGSDLSYEEWKKSDWKQFLWAVRGKCMNVLRGI